MEIRKTITTIFIVPTLKLSRDDLKGNNLLNGYIEDGRRDVQYEDAVYLLFKPDNIEKFREFLEKQYEKNHMLIDDYDYEDGFVVLVYKLDQKYKEDYDLIMQGKYSHVSDKFKALFPKVVKIMKNGLHKDEISLQFRIFRKSSDLKEYWENMIGADFTDDMEVWPGWQQDKEVLDLTKVKEELYENA